MPADVSMNQSKWPQCGHAVPPVDLTRAVGNTSWQTGQWLVVSSERLEGMGEAMIVFSPRAPARARNILKKRISIAGKTTGRFIVSPDRLSYISEH
jgi:hypothetical protein